MHMRLIVNTLYQILKEEDALKRLEIICCS